MANDEKRITLPNKEEMLTRLLGVDDDSHLQEQFYPILLRKAGQVLVPQGVGMMLMLAIATYTKDMPVAAGPMYARAPQFIDALVSDEEVAAEAKAFLQEALAE